MDTQQYGQRFQRLLMLADGRVSARNARGWKLEGRKEESPGNNVRNCLRKDGIITRSERKWLREELEDGGFVLQKKVLWNIAHTRVLEGRGAVPKEDGDLFREYQAMREENFLSSWLREDVQVTTRRRGHEQKSPSRGK